MTDFKTKWDRIGDRSYSTFDKKVKCFIWALLGLFFWANTAVQAQNVLQSYHKTHDQVMREYLLRN